MIDYKLVFDSESQADEVIEQVTGELHPKEYALHVIGLHTKQDWPNGEDEPPVTTQVSDKWLVDLRLREPDESLDQYDVVVETPIHSFS